MQCFTIRRGALLGLGLGAATIAVAAFSMSPRAHAEDSGIRRGSVARTTQSGPMPKNDDFRFRPVVMFGNSGGVPCPEDIDGSGEVSFEDILAILTAWGTCDGCPEDLDGSGEVAFGDLVQLLAAWGPCS